MRFFRRAATALFLLGANPALAEQVEDHFHWRPAADDGRPHPWAILLPGASGLEIFGDKEHYFRFAKRLNGAGIDVLVVHYQEATRFLPDTKKGKPGPRIARIVGYAVEDSRAKGRLDVRCEGVVVGWSLGGEGMWEIAAEGRSKLPGLSRAIGFYPSVRGQAKGYENSVPVTIFQGNADRVTRQNALIKFEAASARPEYITIHTYADAVHGFDIASLAEPKMGGKIAFDAAASEAALAEVDRLFAPTSMGCALD
ncbi:MAG: dienelactone hydrolase family protein [Sphingomonadaceae bacterium]|nr:dienelactone hydrolase family protein [Sphingomonadaceae bacterium]